MLAILNRISRSLHWYPGTALRAALALLALFFAIPAQACQLEAASGPVSFGTVTSANVYGGISKVNSTATGIKCTTILSVLGSSIFGIEITGPIPPLTLQGVANDPDTIPLSIAWTDSDLPLSTNTRFMDGNSVILGLVHSSGGKVNLNFRTSPALGVRAGIYKTSVQVKWYYSICTIGLLGSLVCVAPTNSLGLKRTCLLGVACGEVTDWGSGTPVTINVEMEVTKDCTLSASPVDFGSAAFPDHFPTVTNNVAVRCTAGETYKVRLGDGQNFSNSLRRMKSPANDYMAYEIWKDALHQSRWGESATELWYSADASVNGGTLSGTVSQLFTYYAKILATQPSGSTQPAGVYKDTLRVSVDF